jgi:hypothetical protein
VRAKTTATDRHSNSRQQQQQHRLAGEHAKIVLSPNTDEHFQYQREGLKATSHWHSLPYFNPRPDGSKLVRLGRSNRRL